MLTNDLKGFRNSENFVLKYEIREEVQIENMKSLPFVYSPNLQLPIDLQTKIYHGLGQLMGLNSNDCCSSLTEKL